MEESVKVLISIIARRPSIPVNPVPEKISQYLPRLNNSWSRHGAVRCDPNERDKNGVTPLMVLLRILKFWIESPY